MNTSRQYIIYMYKICIVIQIVKDTLVWRINFVYIHRLQNTIRISWKSPNNLRGNGIISSDVFATSGKVILKNRFREPSYEMHLISPFKISNIGMERWRPLRVATILVPHFSLHPLITSLPRQHRTKTFCC